MVDFLYRNIIPIILVLALHYTFFLVASLFWYLETDVPTVENIVDVEFLEDEEVAALLDELDIQPAEMDYEMANVSNMVADANAEQGDVKQTWSDAAMSEDVYNELKEFEQAEFNRLNDQHEANNPTDPNDATVIEETGGNPTNSGSDDEVKSNAASGVVTVEYSLKGRYDKNLPIPAYMCVGSGKVVVDIKVNNKGNVTSVKVNEAQTSTTRSCLIEAALKKAGRSSFNSDVTADKSQSGTITYVFVSQ